MKFTNVNLGNFDQVYLFKNILNFTIAGESDFVAAVKHLLVLYYSVDLIFFSFWIMGFIVDF